MTSILMHSIVSLSVLTVLSTKWRLEEISSVVALGNFSFFILEYFLINRIWGTYNDPPTASEVRLLMTEGDMCPNDISRETEVFYFLVYRGFILSFSFHAILLFHPPSMSLPSKRSKLVTTSSRLLLPSFVNLLKVRK